jgi:diacylglycerol kinase family enzyme
VKTDIKHLLIVNPKPFARKGNIERITSSLETVFQNNDRDYEIHISRFPRDAIGVIKEKHIQLSSKAKLRVYAVGGDGMLFDCLNGIVGSDAELCAVPYGASNDFVRGFGDEALPLFREAGLLAEGRVFQSDIFMCNTNYALNYCAVGLAGAAALFAQAIVETSEQRLSIFPRYLSLAYDLGALSALFKRELREQRYQVMIDGVDYSGKYTGIFIANGPCYGGNKIVAHGAKPDDGALDVLFTKSAAIPRIFSGWTALQHGRAGAHPELFCEARGARISIRSDGAPLQVCVDGEAFRDSHIDIEICPGALPFIVPRELFTGKGRRDESTR